jgi:hypothetical protein
MDQEEIAPPCEQQQQVRREMIHQSQAENFQLPSRKFSVAKQNLRSFCAP